MYYKTNKWAAIFLCAVVVAGSPAFTSMAEPIPANTQNESSNLNTADSVSLNFENSGLDITLSKSEDSDIKTLESKDSNTENSDTETTDIENSNTEDTDTENSDRKTLGENAVIGSGAVVVENVEPRTTVVGVPAKKLVKKSK